VNVHREVARDTGPIPVANRVSSGHCARARKCKEWPQRLARDRRSERRGAPPLHFRPRFQLLDETQFTTAIGPRSRATSECTLHRKTSLFNRTNYNARPHRVQACTRGPSRYPLGTRAPQPPAGALLARWPGEFASLGLVSGCDRSQRGCSCACRLQQHLPGSMSAATRQPIDL